MTKNIVLLSLVTGVLFGCADPYVPKSVDNHITQKNCPELDQEARQLAANIQSYENEGWLKPSYVLVAPAIVSKMRYNDAIEASRKRLRYVMRVMDIKGCFVSAEYRDYYVQRFTPKDVSESEEKEINMYNEEDAWKAY